MKRRVAYLRQYGSHCMAYSTLQPGMRYFDMPGVGYIAYRQFKHPLLARRGISIGLADPVCDTQSREHVLTEMLRRQNGHVMYAQISRQVAEALVRLGLRVNRIGIETDLDVQLFCLDGKDRAKLRQWRNKCMREGVVVGEEYVSAHLIKEFETLSAAWLTNRKERPELTLLSRPMTFQHEEGVRFFCARRNGVQLLGLAGFDPMYRGGSVIGYYHNFDRLSPDAPHGTAATITLTALETFRREGLSVLALGMSPLSGLSDDLPHNQRTARFLRVLCRYGNCIYPFRGIESHKRKYAGAAKPVYMACTRGTTIRDVLALMKASRCF